MNLLTVRHCSFARGAAVVKNTRLRKVVSHDGNADFRAQPILDRIPLRGCDWNFLLSDKRVFQPTSLRSSSLDFQ
jgi:hypothetical protein